MPTAAPTSASPSVYVEKHGRRFRAVWRDANGKKQREPFGTRTDAELLQSLCRHNPLPRVLALVRDQDDSDDLVWPAEPAAVTPTQRADGTSAAGDVEAVRLVPGLMDTIKPGGSTDGGTTEVPGRAA